MTSDALRRVLESPPEALTLDQYQSLAYLTDQTAKSGGDDFSFPLLGLFGEVGSLLSELKKKQRDANSYIGYEVPVKEELGDVLWYFALVATRAHLSIKDLVPRTLRDSYRIEIDTSLTFSRLQPQISKTGPKPTATYERTLIRLAGQVGALLTKHTNGGLTIDQEALSESMTAIFGTLIEAADEADVSFACAAHQNLKKIFDRWPLEKIYLPRFDEAFDPEEQIPRLIKIDIFEKTVGNKTYVLQRCNGVNIGDRLTDNKIQEDDYRFHDVFHLGYAAILGWSPVTRALLRVKRKSSPKIDEAEDGARAIIIEEGVSAWIFSKGAHMNYFENLNSLSYDLLKTVHDMVKGFEVERCPLWLWEKAILDGYGVFRNLRQHRGGRVIADLNLRTITFERLPL